MSTTYDTLVIGGGPAGYTAALYAARAGLKTLVVEKMSVGGQMSITDVIDNYPGFEEGIDGITLGEKMKMGAERFGAQTVFGEVVSAELFGALKRVKTASEEFLAKTVVIATGADPRRLGIENEDALVGRGIHYCAHCDGRFYKNKTVAVIGGGNTAVSDALYLAGLAKKVYLIHRRDTLRATEIYVDALMRCENIEPVWNTEVIGAVTADGRVTGLELKSTLTGEESAISLDGAFVSIGRIPVTRLFINQIELDEGGYIVSDESTRTSIDGVYAVGDVRTKPLRQVVTAVSDGAVAAHFAKEYVSSGIR